MIELGFFSKKIFNFCFDWTKLPWGHVLHINKQTNI